MNSDLDPDQLELALDLNPDPETAKRIEAEQLEVVYKQAEASQAYEQVAKIRLEHGLTRQRPLTPSERWAKIQRNRKRPLPPRPLISARDRADVYRAAGNRCVVDRRHYDDTELNIGHLLSLEEAYIMKEVTGEARPWQLAATRRENWVAECSKCNKGHYGLSYPPDEAATLRLNSNTRELGLDGAIWNELVEWLRRAEEWRPRPPYGGAGRR